MKKLIMMMTMAMLSLNTLASFDVNKLMTAGFYIQDRLPIGFAAESNDIHYDQKHDLYLIDVVSHDENSELLATIYVTVNSKNEVTRLASKVSEVQFLTSVGIEIDYGFIPKSKGFFSEWIENGFWVANEKANERHIAEVLKVKPYTIFSGNVYIKAGEEVVSVSLSKLQDKTDAQVLQAIEEAVVSQLSEADSLKVATMVQSEIKQATEEALRLSRKVAQEVVEGINMSSFKQEVAKKVEADCDEIGGDFYTIADGSWACIGGTH